MAWSSPWPSVGNALDTTTYKDHMFYHQAYQGDNFLELLVPQAGDETKFFGTHVLNVFIAQRFYGWVNCGDPDQYEFSWPPAGFEVSLARYLACRERFASYKTLVWVDRYSAQLGVSENPSTDWPSMMNDTGAAIENFCASTPGFEFMGYIDSQVPPSFFEAKINEFLVPQPYKI